MEHKHALGRKGGNTDKPLTDREMLIAEFAYKCCEKGDNIDMMRSKLSNFWSTK